MRISIKYIKSLLDIILDHEKPDFRIDHPQIKPLWENDEKLDELVFHMEILEDQGLVEPAIDASSIGFRRSGNGQFIVSVIPLRLTALGHQFASDLSKPGVIEKLTTSFKEAGPSEAVKVVFALGKKALEDKLEDVLS